MSLPSSPRILALDPGTHFLGYAVLQGPELLYHGVKILPATRSDATFCRATTLAVREIVEHLQPTVLALERSYGGRTKRQARLLKQVVTLYRLGRRHRLEVVAFAPATVRKFLCGTGRASKREVALMITWRYPELRPFVVRERRWKERFHGHMFDAVAVGLMALARL